MTKLLRTLAVAAVASTGAAQAADVAIFTDTTYVDYDSASSGAEASNLEATLTQQGHAVSRFSGTSDTGLALALAGKDALVLPELEKSPATSLFAALGTAARAVIVDFVENGGTLIFHFANTKSLELVNGLFGYSPALTTTATAGTYVTSAGLTSGTAFHGGPPSLPGLSGNSALDFTSLPAESRHIYITGNGDAVSIITQGAGRVIFIGWDWDDAFPIGVNDGGWLSVLNSAVNEAVDPTKAKVALLADTAYVDYYDTLNSASLAIWSEASNAQASIQREGHQVMPFTDLSAPGLSTLLEDRDALVLVDTFGGLVAALSTSARAEIVDFVNAGGKLYILKNSETNLGVVNALFGFSLASGDFQPTYDLDAVEAAGTTFAGGPSTLDAPSDTSSLSQASLPPGSRAIYRTGTDVAVATIPVGCGGIVYLGWDWFDAVPVGSNGPLHVEVLNRALGEGKRGFVRNDFNGDGHSDILWRRNTGKLIMWLMDGGTKAAVGSPGAVSLAWTMAGTGDFNKDCKADIVWRNASTGANVLWLMNSFASTAGSIGGVPGSWGIASVSDYNADGASDLLWRNDTTGANIIWHMDGFSTLSTPSIGAIPTDWAVED
ncbi:MAG: VCBS repeat-containing protein [Rhodospirillales bacterium]|nr:VCBS repeat-containing protein [Rhodospirillales bacterium]MDH3966552.1 VCBS repeat-containing protein [Rhodospirillales bacterium]